MSDVHRSPLRIRPDPSPRLALGLLAVHGLAAVALWSVPVPIWLQAGIGGALLGTLVGTVIVAPVPSGQLGALAFGVSNLRDPFGPLPRPIDGFGAPGEGYVRMTLCLPKERLAEAVDRMAGAGF